jgi:hypothetical protein
MSAAILASLSWEDRARLLRDPRTPETLWDLLADAALRDCRRLRGIPRDVRDRKLTLLDAALGAPHAREESSCARLVPALATLPFWEWDAQRSPIERYFRMAPLSSLALGRLERGPCARYPGVFLRAIAAFLGGEAARPIVREEARVRFERMLPSALAGMWDPEARLMWIGDILELAWPTPIGGVFRQAVRELDSGAAGGSLLWPMLRYASVPDPAVGQAAAHLLPRARPVAAFRARYLALLENPAVDAGVRRREQAHPLD